MDNKLSKYSILVYNSFNISYYKIRDKCAMEFIYPNKYLYNVFSMTVICRIENYVLIISEQVILHSALP